MIVKSSRTVVWSSRPRVTWAATCTRASGPGPMGASGTLKTGKKANPATATQAIQNIVIYSTFNLLVREADIEHLLWFVSQHWTWWQDDIRTRWHYDMMTQWHDHMMTFWHDNMLTRWHDDRKLCRRLIVWYILLSDHNWVLVCRRAVPGDLWPERRTVEWYRQLQSWWRSWIRLPIQPQGWVISTLKTHFYSKDH